MTLALGALVKSVKTASIVGRSASCACPDLAPTGFNGDPMRAKPSTGVVALSIYSFPKQTQDFGHSKQQTESAQWLIQLLNEHHFPATWFLPDMFAKVVRPKVASSSVAHELGILIDNSQSERRADFAREIDRHRLIAANAGMNITSLAVSGGTVQQLDMLIKRGINALCPLEIDGASTSRNAMDWNKIETRRFGIWNLNSTLRIGDGGWLAAVMSRKFAKRQIVETASASKFCHLLVSLDRVGRTAVRRTLRAVIAQTAVLRTQDKLEALTLAGVVDHLTARPAIQRAQSILRVA
jgi:hypothetical protein